MADKTNPIAQGMLQKRYLKWKENKQKSDSTEVFPNNPKLQAELDSLDNEDRIRRNALFKKREKENNNGY